MTVLTDAEKRRKAALDKAQLDKLPTDIPIQYWEGYELRALSRHNTKAGIQALGETEKKIKE